MHALRAWCGNVYLAIKTVAQGMYVTLWYFIATYRRRTFTERFEYPELPVPVKPRYRGYHRFDLTTCIGCDKCARAGGAARCGNAEGAPARWVCGGFGDGIPQP